MNTRTHEIIREYIDILVYQAINRQLTWETSAGDLDIRYSIKDMEGKELLGASFSVLSTSGKVELTINGEKFKTANKPIIERVSMLFRIINYEKKENIISDETIKFMRKYIADHR
ncbi:MAG: hypothetical protein IJU91_09310 [Selenomonadaceae bacterium]|nr:hypothetical protein [Selenomonadaceae bacterium]